MFDSILIVCTGNICRSPIGERYLRKLLPDKKIDSAGTGALIGYAADESAIKIASKNNMSLEGHKGTQFTVALGRQYDLILVMERTHLEQISRMAPEVRGKTMLFGHWLDQKEIPDPYRKSEEAFASVYQLIEQAGQRWVENLGHKYQELMHVIDKNKIQSKDSDEIDLGRLFGEFIDHRKLIISVTALFTFCSLLFAIFATPIYQADAMIQVEQKQANAILSNLSQMLPNSQPQSAPEVALLQSRMILGKTVDDLNLQAVVKQEYFPIFGRGFARLTDEKEGSVYISRLYIAGTEVEPQELKLIVENGNKYTITDGQNNYTGIVGNLLEGKGFTIKIEKIDAKPGSVFSVNYISRLKAITNLKELLSVSDQGKDTGILTISMTGDNPLLIKK
jgi:protein-tyrosine-phosphatase